jgi:hypothetical protein
MSVFKYHAFIYFMRPPPWYGTLRKRKTKEIAFHRIFLDIFCPSKYTRFTYQEFSLNYCTKTISNRKIQTGPCPVEFYKRRTSCSRYMTNSCPVGLNKGQISYTRVYTIPCPVVFSERHVSWSIIKTNSCSAGLSKAPISYIRI